MSSDDEDGEKGVSRINIDDLGVIDLTGPDEGEEQDLMQPVRLKREAHRDRAIGLNADGATTIQDGTTNNELGGSGEAAVAFTDKRKGKQRAKDVEIVGSSEMFHGTYSDSDEGNPPIKTEPTDDDPVPVLVPPPQQDVPSSPESKRRGGKDRSITKRTLSGSAAERPVYQTQEEMDEWERHQRDLEILYEELGTIALPSAAVPNPDRDGAGDATMDGTDDRPRLEGEKERDKKADKVYLFQFPPILPDLRPVIVKPDPDAPTEGGAEEGDAMLVDDEAAKPAIAAKAGDAPTVHAPRLPPGAVGKLRIHRSGKATLDWGGLTLSVGMGMAATFLQDVVVASVPESKRGVDGDGGGGGGGDEGAGTGWAMAMGQVKGNFVVTPDWEEILKNA
ncbi:hypothetical protein BAUCODRAFT_31844 [Baudoinia panamericana UAMH 10762]|uniref:RNA polymerase III RPC4-domain-containing protein n=1 Tax=Baudoinia panamericana (strain UAMH 10762) TaxID=717646 RepID=M2N1M8_BAUPA|nr:uncharacterized protein BAUCODRAFT_31844 [Baudoinia panamericana UAMH 10762]EMC97838.1 hypothetical protein BAUCODRAFT_31844 [Baudoinia panamericana UAMH 10762]